MADNHPVIAIVGPTASGKTKTAICVAKRFNGEILSMDSMQIYCGMDIGTAKADKDELEAIPHHLISIIHPNESFSVAVYQKLARELMQEIRGRNKIPVFCGGTGLYLQALEHPLSFGESDTTNIKAYACEAPTNRDSLKQKTSSELYDYLKAIDPDAAINLHINDRQRVIRAIEIFEKTHIPYSERVNEWYSEPLGTWLKFGLFWPREKLNQRINERVECMFDNGLIEEVKALMKQGISENVQSMNAIGYKETLQFLRQEITLSEAKERTKHRTRQYAKRQMTWFKKDPSIEWIEMDVRDGEQPIHHALLFERIEERLSKINNK